jgi:hypothetical protein
MSWYLEGAMEPCIDGFQGDLILPSNTSVTNIFHAKLFHVGTGVLAVVSSSQLIQSISNIQLCMFCFPVLISRKFVGTPFNLLSANGPKPRWPVGSGDCTHVQEWPCEIRVHCQELDPKVRDGLKLQVSRWKMLERSTSHVSLFLF